ncbi:MAG: hypothetical protein AAAFM81_08895 [Pseudomonadota bacterium]
MMFNRVFVTILLVVSLTACNGRWTESRCHELLGLLSYLHDGIAPEGADFELAQRELLQVEVTRSSYLGYQQLSVSESSFTSELRVMDNKPKGFTTEGLARGLDIAPPRLETEWDRWLYLATNKKGTEGVNCEETLSDATKQSIVFFAAYGSQMWLKTAPVVRLVVDEQDHFIAFVSENTARDMYLGLLVHRLNDKVYYTDIQFHDPDVTLAVLVETANLNRKLP